jgi:acyl-CoA thioester hydrolase
VLAATGECLYLHVDTAAGRTAPLPADRQAAVDALRDAHAARVTTPNEGRRAEVWDDSAPIDAPLRLHTTNAPPEWMDYNDHMSESCFLLAFGDSSDAFFRFIGIDEAYRAAGHSLYTTQTHLHHRQEVSLGEPLVMTLQVLDHDRRRLHIYHEMRHGETDELIAMAEQLLVHVDMEAGRSADMPEDLYEHVEAIRQAHAGLPRPAVVGHPIAIRHST